MFSSGNHKSIRGSIESIGASVAIFEVHNTDQSFIFVTANSLFEEVLDKSIVESIGAKTDEIFPRYIDTPIKACFRECVEKQTAIEREIVIEANGSSRWWRFVVSPILPYEQPTTRLMVTCIEITDKKLLEKQLITASQRFEAVVETAYDGIISIDEDQNIKLINTAAKEIFQLEGESVIGEPLTSLIPQRYRHNHHTHIKNFRESEIDARPMQSRAAVRGLRRDGSEFPVEVTISKINVAGKSEMTAVLRDISERSRLIDELSKAAIEDHLTGLPNRRYFERDLQKELQRASRFDNELSMILLDIDHFKHINDDFGHAMGDLLLKQLSFVLRKKVREIDTLSRWGGEEFVFLLPETNESGAMIWAEKIRSCVERQVFDLDGQEVQITVSLGVACIKGKVKDMESLFKLADQNLYKAKNSGRNRVVGSSGE